MDAQQSQITQQLDLSGLTLAGRYTVLSKLGEGGMASVYMAHDKVLDRQVALKTLPRTNLSDVELLRFQREARTASTISHPNLIQMLNFDVLDSGQPFLVMELINGVSLSDLISKQGPLRLERVLDIIEQIATGMSAVHKCGIVHRDLKASNVMLVGIGNKPVVKILDFGIAKSLTDDCQVSTITQAGQIFGSPNFMSPEQVRGDKLDNRADIYSLGCIMFYLLTGAYVFKGETVMEICSKHLSDSPPSVSETIGEGRIPEVVEDFLACMLKKDPNERFQSMEEVARAARELQNQLSQAGDDHSTSKGPQASNQLSRKGIAILASISLLVLAGGAFAFYQAWDFTHRKIESKPKLVQEGIATRSRLVFELIDEQGSKIAEGDPFSLYGSNYNILYLNGRSATERLKDAIKKNRHIEMVVFNYGSITDSDAKLIGKLHPSSVNLEGSSGITDNIIQILSEIKSLHGLHLDLSKSFTPKGLSYLARLPALTYISLRDCNLTDEHIKSLAGVKNLRWINVQGSRKLTLNTLNYLCRKPYYVQVVADKGALAVVPFSKRKEIFTEMKIRLEDNCPDAGQQMAKLMGNEEDSITQFLSPESRRKLLQPRENGRTGE